MLIYVQSLISSNEEMHMFRVAAQQTVKAYFNYGINTAFGQGSWAQFFHKSAAMAAAGSVSTLTAAAIQFGMGTDKNSLHPLPGK